MNLNTDRAQAGLSDFEKVLCYAAEYAAGQALQPRPIFSQCVQHGPALGTRCLERLLQTAEERAFWDLHDDYDDEWVQFGQNVKEEIARRKSNAIR